MRTLLIALLLPLLVQLPANAAIFERDFLQPGDGYLTYDDVNRREWLDLTFTTGMELDHVIAAREYESFSNFRFATMADIEDFADSAGVVWLDRGESTQTDQSHENAVALHRMLGNVFSLRVDFSAGSSHENTFIERLTSFGQVAAKIEDATPSFDGTVASLELINAPSSGVVRLANRSNSASGGMTTDFSFRELGLASGDLGPFWLYREAIPEPATAMLTTISLLTVATTRSRRCCL